MKEVTVRDYKDGDEREINLLFNSIFSENRSSEEWHCKFRKNPLGDVTLIAVAESDGTIVGQYANLPVLFKYQDKILRVGLPVDNFVHEDFRGGIKGIQKELFNYQHKLAGENNIAFGIGFPNRDAYVVGKRLLKYRDIGEIQVLFRRLNWRLAIKNRFPWFPGSILKIVQHASGIGFRLSLYFKELNSFDGVTIHEVDSFDERFNVLWKVAKERHKIIGVRNKEYLNWRYKKMGTNYRIFAAERANVMIGYIVIKIKKSNESTVGYIVDFLATDNDKGLSALLRKALSEFISRKVDFVLCWVLPDMEAYAALRDIGFTARDEFSMINFVYFVFKAEEIEEPFLKNLNNWYITMGDSDTF